MMADNIYKKINEMRAELHSKIANGEIKKGGKNPFHKSNFFSLDDLVGPIQHLMNEKNIYHEVNISERAVMKLINLDNTNETVEVSFPIPAFNTMQDAGKAITYSRRYLYYLLFNISEIDDDYAAEDKAEATEQVKEQEDEESGEVEDMPKFLKYLSKQRDKPQFNEKWVRTAINAACANKRINLQEKKACLKFLEANGMGALA